MLSQMRDLTFVRRRVLIGTAAAAVAALVASSAPGRTEPETVEVAAVRPAEAAPTGLSAPGWRVEAPAEQAGELGRLVAREARPPVPRRCPPPSRPPHRRR
jgi:hypothetical protein